MRRCAVLDGSLEPRPRLTGQSSRTATVCTLALLSSLLLGAGLVSAADTGVPASYPLKKCVVSNEDLGTMGKAVKVTHEGIDVYLCCKSCIKKFDKKPDKFVAQVKVANK